MAEKTVISNVCATKAHRAVRKLRRYGILSYWDRDNRALVIYVAKCGERICRQYAYAALESRTDD